MHTAAGGMRLENYLSTRTFELVVHRLDIAAAVPDIEPPEFSDQLLSEIARVGATAAVLQGRGVELMLAHRSREPQPGFQHRLTCGWVGVVWAAANQRAKGRGQVGVASTNDLKNGMVLDLDGQLWSVVWFQHHKPGKGNTVVRTKLKHVLSGKVVDRTFNSTQGRHGERRWRDMQYLYHDGSGFVFMDTTTYDQLTIPDQTVGDAKNYLLEEQVATVAMHDGNPLYLELPASVELVITYTEPGLQGDRSTGGTKPATVQTAADPGSAVLDHWREGQGGHAKW